MNDATYLKAHRTVSSLRSKKGAWGPAGTLDRTNRRRHEHQTACRRPIRFFMTAGQMSDYTGAAALLGSLPSAQWLLADRGYDADWYRDALKGRGIKPCIPGRRATTDVQKSSSQP
jgi:hypothetical protein